VENPPRQRQQRGHFLHHRISRGIACCSPLCRSAQPGQIHLRGTNPVLRQRQQHAELTQELSFWRKVKGLRFWCATHIR
jgi:hypothetical protein